MTEPTHAIVLDFGANEWLCILEQGEKASKDKAQRVREAYSQAGVPPRVRVYELRPVK